MAFPASGHFLDALRGGAFQSVVTADIYYNGTFIVTLPVSSGSVAIDATANVRRTLTAVIADPSYIPIFASSNLAPYGQEVHLNMGIQYADQTQELIPMGVFEIYSITWNDAGGAIPTITAYDYGKKIDDAVLAGPVDRSGEKAFNMIQRFVLDVLETNVIIDPDLQDYFLPGGSVFDNNRWDAINTILGPLGATGFFDVHGNFIVQPVPVVNANTTDDDISWTVDAGPNGVMVDAQRSVSREGCYNFVTALGTATSDTTEAPPAGYAADNDPTSPTYWGPASSVPNGPYVTTPFGDVVLRYENSVMTTAAQCAVAAQAQLAMVLGIAKSLDLTAVPNPALDGGDIIKVVFFDGSFEYHLIDSMSIGLNDGSFTMTTRSTIGQLSLAGQIDDEPDDSGDGGGGDAATYTTRVGAFIGRSDLGAATFGDSLSTWASLTGIPVPVTRWYNASGDFTIGTTLSQQLSAGVRICLTLRPDATTNNATHLAQMEAMLVTLKGMGADIQVTLNHEPFFGGISAVNFVNSIKYYGPTVRKYFPLWVCYSGNDAIESNGYFPGSAFCDGIAIDDYASGIESLTAGQDMADAHGMRLAMWEFNAANDFGIDPSPVTSVSNASNLGFFNDIQTLFTARLAAGKPNGDILFFSTTGATTGTSNFLTSGLSDNGGFESSLGTWVGGSASITRDTSQHHSGSACLKATSAGAGCNFSSVTSGSILTGGLPVTPGTKVGGSGWFKAGATGRVCTIGITFFDASGASISTLSGSGVTDNTSNFVFASAVVTAPALSAFCRLTPNVASTVSTEFHWFDDPQFGLLPASIDHTQAIQYNWDYRIPALVSMASALDNTTS